MSTVKRVLVVEPSPILRCSLTMHLAAHDGIEMVGGAADGSEVLALTGALRLDVLVLNPRLDDQGAVALMERLRKEAPDIRIVAFADETDVSALLDLIACGVDAVVMRQDDVGTLAEAVWQADGEEMWLSPCTTRRLLPKIVVVQSLTHREVEVLRLAAAGRSNEAIASTLGIAVGTVRNHLSSIYGKLSVRRRNEATAWAWRSGLLQP